MLVATSEVGRQQRTTTSSSPASLDLALAAARVAQESRGRDVVVLDMRELTPIFDYFVVATGTSQRQLRAMSDDIDHALAERFNEHQMRTEGYTNTRWILLDYGDVVIHLFDPDTRRYYALEELWGGAKRVPFDGAEAPNVQLKPR
jgi:ribosome-associated protein